MNTDHKQTDILNNLFRLVPEEELPASFRSNIMQQVMKEALRIKKRNERIGLAATILASLVMITLAVLSFIYMDLPEMEITIPHLSNVPFYLYIGFLALFLLGADYKFRQLFKRKQKKQATDSCGQ